MFNYAELNYLISGTGEIDVQDWMAHAKHHTNSDAFIKMFWQVVLEMTEE